jgi:hypothetical protein
MTTDPLDPFQQPTPGRPPRALARRGPATLPAIIACGAVALACAALAAEPFADRGYYLTFMRMPVMGLPEWKQAFDCFAEDQANVVILWMAGGFRSRKFAITWRYNEEHENVRHDFVRELIDHAHRRGIRVLLGLTPFGYDGVNQLPIEQPGLKARKPDGQPVDAFGIHAWGWNLCAAQPAAQTFMREYAREMFFEFYPNADGLFLESSDYGICHCPDCGVRYFEREFVFVRGISEDLWAARPGAMVVVYPHYFTGKNVPGLNATAARQVFDPRWTLFFTPHSAHFDRDLLLQARSAIFWGDSPVLGTPRQIQAHARTARQNGMTGFVPSFEAFSYVPYRSDGGEPYVVGRRRSPFGLDALGEGKMPYGSLLACTQRFAVREFSADPDLPFDVFKQRLAQYLFGKDPSPGAVDDLLALQELWVQGSDWYWPSPLLDPDFLAARAQRLNWPSSRRAEYRQRLLRLQEIASRSAKADSIGERQMHSLAQMVVDRWRGKESILNEAK